MALAEREHIDLVNLDHIITHYNSETDRCLSENLADLEECLWTKICAYDRQINHDFVLCEHLQRISQNGAAFLDYLGFTPKVVENFRRAILYSKLGYVHANDDYNGFRTHDPFRMAGQHYARQVSDNGREILENSISAMPDTFQNHPHTRVVIPALMDFHNECVNGAGPFARNGTAMGVIIRVAVITDSYEHQFHTRPGTIPPATPIEAIEHMCGYNGATPGHRMFDRKLLESYARFQSSRQTTGATTGQARETAEKHA